MSAPIVRARNTVPPSTALVRVGGEIEWENAVVVEEGEGRERVIVKTYDCIKMAEGDEMRLVGGGDEGV
jgi:hypothetical protein